MSLESDPAQHRLATAVLFGALARTLGESPQFDVRMFLHYVKEGEEMLRNWEVPPVVAIETLRWTREIALGQTKQS